MLAGGQAAVDVAEACGRQTVADLPPDPINASSFGAGQLIAAAVVAGAGRITIGVGGTASTDGGEGLRRALGDAAAGVELVAALDVRNPLLGPDGARGGSGHRRGRRPSRWRSSTGGWRRFASPPPISPARVRAAASERC